MHEKCSRCKHRKVLRSANRSSALSLCMVDPYDWDSLEDGTEVTTWLEVDNFNADKCIHFEESPF